MKKMFSLFLGVGLVFGAVSCSSEYDATPDVPKEDIGNQFRGEMTATLNDSISFSADSKTYTFNSFEGINSVAISGMEYSQDKNPDFSKTISFTIGDYLGPNTYNVGFSAMATYTSLEGGMPINYTAKSGEESYITITQDGDKWEGSFQFIMQQEDGQGENVHITQGNFSIPK